MNGYFKTYDKLKTTPDTVFTVAPYHEPRATEKPVNRGWVWKNSHIKLMLGYGKVQGSADCLRGG